MPSPRRTALRGVTAAFTVALLAGCASHQSISPGTAASTASTAQQSADPHDAGSDSSPSASAPAEDAATPGAGLQAGDQQQSAGTGIQALTQDSIDADAEARQRAEEAAQRGEATVAVTWVATDAPALTVGALAENVLTQDGVCTLTLTRGSEVVVTESAAIASATSTDCGELSVDLADLEPGVWSLTVAFSAPDLGGASQPQEVVIP
ncbi:hypothetical protein [Serinibacter salmoneus]|uniref:Uncharacterized protein n=1 Tax=Serinibacter salmoneus TaxID=556530 RepID=A0A2A9D4W4_9MICO|nr:hypothetical protein [Serinibacter salmoneus]PFG20890.1 hypothetical protein ATL40_2505 [Serinibacter salmoneus]